MHEIRPIGNRPAVRLSDRAAPLNAVARPPRMRQPPEGSAMQHVFAMTEHERTNPELSESAMSGRHGQPALHAPGQERVLVVTQATSGSKANVRRGGEKP